jgi:5'/3'-nucleotidase SurE
MNILIANVKNMRVNEIRALAEALNKKHKITVASHASNKSNRGLAFAFRHEPVRVNPVHYADVVKNSSWVWHLTTKELKESDKKVGAFDGIAGYEFGGDPADSIAIVISKIMEHKKPDLVICGINNGRHMGQDVYCSSNIGMAMEARMFGIPTIAVAVEHRSGGHTMETLKAAAQFIEKNVEQFAKLKLPRHTFLNINIPCVNQYKDFRGVKISRMGKLNQLSKYIVDTDAHGDDYYWAENVERHSVEREIAHAESHNHAPKWYEDGYITIIPQTYDCTDYEKVTEWNKKIRGEMK